MNKCHKGFSLIEVMVALSILAVLAMTIVPTLTIVYGERVTIREQQQALSLIDDRLQIWLYDRYNSVNAEEVDVNGTLYDLQSKTIAHETLQVCVTWHGSNNRSYERCGYAKK
ncbi:competence type IV pilus minor pilin ComGE [Desertibacillus haloalkaliphilus]|uniref:competence type IV pilus minor pilin ComGE n=1 Tax=Desertibacillus haloalkaliphilus TaxID=1328930 RepID=UPI001C26BCA7|nr:competence type IV pilus minor pilin ComGE [Desertibacillus haloalkaliphilus]MBU8908981.1 type II secretion system GspH family protein [Desertibacillus haloalkaliphilus]